MHEIKRYDRIILLFLSSCCFDSEISLGKFNKTFPVAELQIKAHDQFLSSRLVLNRSVTSGAEIRKQIAILSFAVCQHEIKSLLIRPLIKSMSTPLQPFGAFTLTLTIEH